MSTVIGYGLVNAQPISGPHTGSASERLLQVDLPLVSQQKCIQLPRRRGDHRRRAVRGIR